MILLSPRALELLDKAQALEELAERHHDPDTRHIGNQDYNLLMTTVEDLKVLATLCDAIAKVVGLGQGVLEYDKRQKGKGNVNG